MGEEPCKTQSNIASGLEELRNKIRVSASLISPQGTSPEKGGKPQQFEPVRSVFETEIVLLFGLSRKARE